MIELPGNEHRLAREEICVPVLSVIEVSSFDEASSVASDDDYCLCASILTANGKRALRGARMLGAGNVTVISCGERDISTPFRRSKQSGFNGEAGQSAART